MIKFLISLKKMIKGKRYSLIKKALEQKKVAKEPKNKSGIRAKK
jgi:hypothetical protein